MRMFARMFNSAYESITAPPRCSYLTCDRGSGAKVERVLELAAISTNKVRLSLVTRVLPQPPVDYASVALTSRQMGEGDEEDCWISTKL